MKSLSVRGVTKRYGETVAVDGIDFDVNPGELVTLLGPSGCGKTTTLRLLAGLERGERGQIRVDDVVMASAAEGVFVPPERRGIGMVFQSYAIWPHMTVFGNVGYPLKLRGVRKADIATQVERVLELVGLGGLSQRPATDLSGGQQQRVALARALVFEPSVLLLDEPLSNLDAKLRGQMRMELKRLQATTGITTVYVTHDQTESMSLSDRIIVMNAGRIEQVGDPLTLYERPRTQFVADFIGSTNVLAGTVDGPLAGTELLIARTEAGSRVTCVNAAGRPMSRGEQVTLLFRPERVHVGRPGSDSPNEGASGTSINKWQGTVEAGSYFGDRREYFVRVGDELLRVVSSPDVSFDSGDDVVLEVAGHHVLLMEGARNPQVTPIS
jgi:ABC-type Fe3+/spermidine/putrescine transport system ATPase subunit